MTDQERAEAYKMHISRLCAAAKARRDEMDKSGHPSMPPFESGRWIASIEISEIMDTRQRIIGEVLKTEEGEVPLSAEEEANVYELHVSNMLSVLQDNLDEIQESDAYEHGRKAVYEETMESMRREHAFLLNAMMDE